MKRLLHLLVVCCFLGSQVSFTLAFGQEPDTNIFDLVGGRVINKDDGIDKESKKQKKKGKKGKHPKSQEVIIRPDGGNDIKLELDEEKENADVDGDGDVNKRDKEDLEDAIKNIKEIED